MLDPGLVAKQFKDAGTTIITVNMAHINTTSVAEKLSALASPGFAFNFTADLVEVLNGALCQGLTNEEVHISANCFCPTAWIQLVSNTTMRFGECLYFSYDKCSWVEAYWACRYEIANGFLYQEFSEFKMDFVQG